MDKILVVTLVSKSTKQKLLSFLALILCFTSFTCAEESNRVKVKELQRSQLARQQYDDKKIVLSNISKDTIAFVYLSEFSDLVRVHIAPQQIYRLDAYQPLWVSNPHVRHGTIYLLKPSDSLHLFSDKTGGIVFRPIVNNEERENELDIFRYINEKIGKSYAEIFFGTKANSSAMVYFSLLDSLLENRHAREVVLLDDYLSKRKVSFEFAKCAKNILKLEFLSKRLNYLWLNKALVSVAGKAQRNFEENHSKLRDSILGVTCSFPFYKNIGYSYFIRYVQYRLAQPPFLGTRYQRPSSNVLYNFAKREIKEQSKLNNYLFLIVKEELIQNTKINDSLTNMFFQDCTENKYETYIKNILAAKRVSPLEGIDDELLTFTGQRKPYRGVLNSLKGNIVYIDLWASWCMPCRAEMSAERKLMNTFANKRILFLLISQDANINAWKEASEHENIASHRYNFLLPNFEKSALKKSINVATIPRYMIVDKTGRVVNSDAPRPSDPALIPLLEKLAEE